MALTQFGLLGTSRLIQNDLCNKEEDEYDKIINSMLNIKNKKSGDSDNDTT